MSITWRDIHDVTAAGEPCCASIKLRTWRRGRGRRKVDGVREVIEAARATRLLSQYSPDFNPIERFFCNLTALLRSCLDGPSKSRPKARMRAAM